MRHISTTYQYDPQAELQRTRQQGVDDASASALAAQEAAQAAAAAAESAGDMAKEAAAAVARLTMCDVVLTSYAVLSQV